MPRRKSSIYTRKGDTGETGTGSGETVHKDCQLMETLGCLDELNSALGVAIAELQSARAELATTKPRESLDDLCSTLLWCQRQLFTMGATLTAPSPRAEAGVSPLTMAVVEQLESAIDRWDDALPALKNFILPGGGKPPASLHAARAICRRAEREALMFHREHPLSEAVLSFLNRLSDALFVAARSACHALGNEEVIWKA